MTRTPRSYREFERAVLAPLQEYRREPDDRHLERAAAIVRGVAGDASAPIALPERQVFRAVGWVMPALGIRLRTRVLRKLNPQFSVRVTRIARRELGVRASLLRVGFRIEAQGPTEAPEFVVRVVDREGRTHDLPASNQDARFELSTALLLRPDLDDSPTTAPLPFGYIDSASPAVKPVDSDPATWFPALVQAYPAALFILVDSPHGRFLADRAARAMAMFPVLARWTDRYTMSARGSEGRYSSDLTPLTAVRTDGAHELPDGSRLPQPERASHTIAWTPSGPPLLAPDPEWRTYDDARLQDGGTLSVGDSLVIYENSADPANGFVAGQWQTVFGSRANREVVLVQERPAGQSIDEAILLSGRNDDNWFHWLIEYLPRVLMIPGSIGPEVPLVVSSRVPGTGIQALAELTARPVVTLDAELSTRLGRVHVLAPPVQVLDTTTVPWAEGLRVNPAALRAMRAAWSDCLGTPVARRRIFLQRRSRHRGIENEEQLADIARGHGLEIVDPGALSFREQWELFSSAELLAGASGAVMANYIMMQPGSTVIALTSDQLYDFVLPAALAQVAGVDFHYVTGPTATPLHKFADRNHWIHADFSVDAAAFDNALVQAKRKPQPA